MEQSVREYVTEKVKDLISAPSCCAQVDVDDLAAVRLAGDDPLREEAAGDAGDRLDAAEQVD